MGTAPLILVLALCILCHLSTASRIRIENNGYEDTLVSLPPEAAAKDRKSIVSSIKDLFQESSSILSSSTKGRAHFRSVTLLIPLEWGEVDSWLPSKDDTTSFDEAGAASRRQDADVVVSHSSRDFHPYTLHQGGCGSLALRIYLPSNFLLSGDQKGVEFVRLWSELRYGVFPEGGFEDDPKYPMYHQDPRDGSNRTTGCSSSEQFGQCKEHGSCSERSTKSSLMDQYLPNTAVHFCENYLNLGPRHNPDSPSKHNLLCNEEGTWFTVLRSPDFLHGRNSAPKYPSKAEVTFRYVREVAAPRVLVAIDISSQMNKEERYHLTKNAFYQFVTSLLPEDSELSVMLFGGDGNSTLVTSNIHLVDEETIARYLESLPLPDAPLAEDNVCVDCVLEDIIGLVTKENSTFSSAPIVVLVTAEHHLDGSKFADLQRKLQDTEILLYAMAFLGNFDNESLSRASLYSLCSETGNIFVNLEGDLLGNLYNGFHQAVVGPRSNILVYQKYLTWLDEENIGLSFILDKSVSLALQISISGPLFGASSTLEFDKTVLVGTGGNVIQPTKHELIPSLNFKVRNPEAGIYTLKTRRKRGATSPVLVSVYGTPKENSVKDPIDVKVWVEISKYKVPQPPIQIFAEVRKGPYPIQNASVTAYVQHPGGYVETVQLVDDGLGSVDVTEDDGVYSRYFTNFSSVGFYNVNVKVTGDIETNSLILKGPPTYCCGSSFPRNEEVPIGQFLRKAGPVTFRISNVPGDDQCPPAKVTDLRIARAFDQIIALQWTAVGNDMDTGEAAAYELKLFRDRSVLRDRFSDSRLELYSETIEVSSPAAYGTNLYHVLQIPNSLEKDVYYFGIRALDNAGNAGEPSNAVAVWLWTNKSAVIDCTDEPISEKYNSAYKNSALAYLIVFTILFALIFPTRIFGGTPS